MNFKAIFGILILAGAAFEAAAVPITGLYNTGEGSTPGGLDANYALTKTAGTGSAGPTPSEGFSINGNWLANTAQSQWLTPFQNGGATLDPMVNGVYLYTLTFDLTGYDASTASFNGRWATDNSGTMRLNGTVIAVPPVGFNFWTAFSSAGGSFVAGLNTLEFEVTNFAQRSGNPTGLRVEFLGSNVEPIAVPEPASLGLLGACLFGLTILRRRRSAT